MFLHHLHDTIDRFGMWVGVGLIGLAHGLERVGLAGARVFGATAPTAGVSMLNQVAAVVGIACTVGTFALKLLDFLDARAARRRGG
jgi:hypothetical protein